METKMAICLVTSLIASGCMLESHEPALATGTAAADGELRDDGEDYRPPVVPEVAPREIEITDGLLVGDMGEYEDFVAPAYEATAIVSSRSTLLEMHGGEGYWVMTRLLIQGGLTHEELAVGAHLELGRLGADTYSSSVRLTVVGCSGPLHGSWTYDRNAEEIVVDIEEGETPDERVMRFSARFVHEGRDQVVEGSFAYGVH